MKKKTLLLSSLFIFLLTGLTAQDFFYSQYYHAPSRLNPALTGIFYGDLRVTANLRSQWQNEPASYSTQSIQVDWKLLPDQRESRGFWSMGAGINHDNSGSGILNWTDLNLSGSYTQPVGARTLLTIGSQVGVANRRVNYDGLTFGNQFNDGRGTTDLNIPIDDPLFVNRNELQSNYFADFSAGINFHFQTQEQFAIVNRLNKRTSLDVGVALYHINTPDQSFSDGAAPAAPLPIRYSPYLRTVLQLGKRNDLLINATYQRQNIEGQSDRYTQTAAVAALRHYFNRQLGKQVMVELGAGYRFSVNYEAFFPHLTLTYNNWQAGISYDITDIDSNIAPQSASTIELYARYVLAKVRPGRACLIL